MEVTKDMESLFVVNQEHVNKVKDEKASNAVLDAVDDFCDQIDQLNEAADSYAERHNKQGQDAYF